MSIPSRICLYGKTRGFANQLEMLWVNQDQLSSPRWEAFVLMFCIEEVFLAQAPSVQVGICKPSLIYHLPIVGHSAFFLCLICRWIDQDPVVAWPEWILDRVPWRVCSWCSSHWSLQVMLYLEAYRKSCTIASCIENWKNVSSSRLLIISCVNFYVSSTWEEISPYVQNPK